EAGGMWGRHYWGGRRPSDGAAGAEAGGGVVVMFAWLSSQERHVRAYVDLYAALGWACLVCHSDFITLFMPEKAAVLADRVLTLIERRCKGQLSLDDYQLVRDCICGQIYDSSPVDFVSDLGTRFLLHPSVLKMPEPPRVLSWMTRGIASGLDTLFTGKFEAQRKEYWETLYSSVHVGPILIFCSEDDELAPCSVVQNFGRRLLELGGDVNLIKWHSSPHVGHYKHHTEEYRAAVTELLMKASALYTSRKRLNDYSVGTSEDSDTPYSSRNLHKTAVSSSDRLGRVSADPANHFFLPSSMEYHESSSEALKPELFNMPSV
uniref:Peptidase S9 prolyl oligopeptidase catalytic domain-containing protein n=1 Tax=Aegilops tauschii subsp. strangulata TaxID=200361 RepID=A0A453KGT5_AEGTS